MNMVSRDTKHSPTAIRVLNQLSQCCLTMACWDFSFTLLNEWPIQGVGRGCPYFYDFWMAKIAKTVMFYVEKSFQVMSMLKRERVDAAIGDCDWESILDQKLQSILASLAPQSEVAYLSQSQFDKCLREFVSLLLVIQDDMAI
nr:hypothetical protein Iba_chr05eCG7540 [Ipomoea batatas]